MLSYVHKYNNISVTMLVKIIGRSLHLQVQFGVNLRIRTIQNTCIY